MQVADQAIGDIGKDSIAELVVIRSTTACRYSKKYVGDTFQTKRRGLEFVNGHPTAGQHDTESSRPMYVA